MCGSFLNSSFMGKVADPLNLTNGNGKVLANPIGALFPAADPAPAPAPNGQLTIQKATPAPTTSNGTGLQI